VSQPVNDDTTRGGLTRAEEELIAVKAVVRGSIEKWREEAASIRRHPMNMMTGHTAPPSAVIREKLADELEEVMRWTEVPKT